MGHGHAGAGDTAGETSGAAAGPADGATEKGSKHKGPAVGEKRKRTNFTATQSFSRKRLPKASSILGTKDRRWLNFLLLRGRSSTLGIGTTRARSLRTGSELVLVSSLWGIDLVRMMKYA